MPSSRRIRGVVLGFVVFAFVSFVAVTAANYVPESGASDQTLPFTIPAPTPTPGVPPECAGISGLSIQDAIYDSGSFSGSSHNDLIFGSAIDDIINGRPGDDCILGLEGNDWLIGGNHYDVLLGGPGDDTLDGGGHNDTCYGGPGADTYISCGVCYANLAEDINPYPPNCATVIEVDD